MPISAAAPVPAPPLPAPRTTIAVHHPHLDWEWQTSPDRRATPERFDSVGEAIAAARELTRGDDRPGAVVVGSPPGPARGPRFSVLELRGSNPEAAEPIQQARFEGAAQAWAGLTPTTSGEFDASASQIFVAEDVLAAVDGDTVWWRSDFG